MAAMNAVYCGDPVSVDTDAQLEAPMSPNLFRPRGRAFTAGRSTAC